MKGYFFNAEPTTDLERHPTGYDREYDADSHAAFFEPLFGAAGVLLAEGQAEPCQVYNRGAGMLGIREGAAYIKGRMVVFDGNETLQASAGYVVARMNKSMEVRDFQLLIVDAPIQAEGDIYDLPLAQIGVSGQTVSITDKRVYLSAKVLGGHRHNAEDVDGVVGHKHAASDINAGVMASERVPLLVDANRIVTKVGPYAENQVSSQQYARTVTVPFAKALTALPKKVYLFISPYVDDEDRAGKPQTVGGNKSEADIMMMLMYNEATGKFDAFIGTHERPNSTGKDAYTYSLAYYADVGKEGSGYYSGLFSITHKGSSSSDAYWVGTGGAAFFNVNFGGKSQYARAFRYSKTGVSFELVSSGGDSTTRFNVNGYAFD